MIRVDTSRRSEDDLVDTGLMAGSKDDAVQRQVGCALCLMELQVAAAAVIRSQMEHHVRPAHTLQRRTGIEQIAFEKGDPSGDHVAFDIGEAAAREVVDDANGSAFPHQGVHQVGADEGSAAGDENRPVGPVHGDVKGYRAPGRRAGQGIQDGVVHSVRD